MLRFTAALLTAMILTAMPEQAEAAGANVIFFGGAQSKKAAMSRCYPSYTNFGYPASSSQVDWAVKKILSNPNQPFVVAGHSSGAKYANQVARKVSQALRKKKIKPKLTLVDLDGYAPRDVPKDIKRVCWTASNGRRLRARNAGSMSKGNNCGEVKVYSAPKCSSAWCLHFSMVNTSVSGLLNKWPTQGYANCRGNPQWGRP